MSPRWLAIAALAPPACMALCLAAEWYAVSSIGYLGHQIQAVSIGWAMASLLAIPLAMVTTLAGLAVAVSARTRRLGLRLAALGIAAELGLVTAWLPMFNVMRSGEIRRAGFRAQARRGETVVKAIRKYEQKHGRPPPSLASLVPEHFPDVPPTGMPAYPRWEYLAGDDASSFRHQGEAYAAAGRGPAPVPWVLYMRCPRGVLNWDIFLYYPGEDYPAEGYGGTIERIGRFAYVHE